MKLSAFFVASVFLTSVAFARPSRLADHIAAREARRSRLNIAITAKNSTHAESSNNWAGVVLTNPPLDQTYTSITGTLIVPTVNGPGSGGASAWVGIDGYTASQSILQSGVDFIFNESSATYFAWFEWFPNPSTEFENFPVSAGDVITVIVESVSSTAGVVGLFNENTGQSVEQNVDAPSLAAALLGQNAEWIVEDFEENGSLVPFASFTPVTFINATAFTSSGVSLGPSGGTVLEIEQNGEVLASVSTSGSSITVTRK